MLKGNRAAVKCRGCQWNFPAIDFFPLSAGQCLLLFARCKLEENFAADNFDCVASNADVNYPVIVLRCADKNAAGPLHLDALFDEHVPEDRWPEIVWFDDED